MDEKSIIECDNTAFEVDFSKQEKHETAAWFGELCDLITTIIVSRSGVDPEKYNFLAEQFQGMFDYSVQFNFDIFMEEFQDWQNKNSKGD